MPSIICPYCYRVMDLKALTESKFTEPGKVWMFGFRWSYVRVIVSQVSSAYPLQLLRNGPKRKKLNLCIIRSLKHEICHSQIWMVCFKWSHLGLSVGQVSSA